MLHRDSHPTKIPSVLSLPTGIVPHPIHDPVHHRNHHLLQPVSGMLHDYRTFSDRKLPNELPAFGPTMAPTVHPLANIGSFLQRPLVAGKTDPKIKITLENEELWEEFHKLGTEMIITKLGRRMFPTLKVNISGMDRNEKYYVLMDLALADDSRYRFTSAWIRSGNAEPQWPSRIYVHPDSPATGAQWMKHEISFQKVKLTNNTMDQQGHLVLTSMHKYVPRIHVIPASEYASYQWGLPVTISTSEFHVCSFIAVTAYANERMTQLKIDNNPFAKGFRENGQLRMKKRQLEHASPGNEKKCRPNSANSSHSSLNTTDDECQVATVPAVSLLTKDDSVKPVSGRTVTNFSIARLVGDSTPAARPVRSDPLPLYPPFHWLNSFSPLHPCCMITPRMHWSHVPLVPISPMFPNPPPTDETP